MPSPPKDTYLVWKDELFGWEPAWAVDPSINAVTTIAKNVLKTRIKTQPDEDSRQESVQANHLAQGAFNKLYSIQTSNETYVMRIALPVDPGFKTDSEAATLQCVHVNTTIPVPTVIAFDSTRKNMLGLEWMMMSLMPGKVLEEVWCSLSWRQKKALVKAVAASLAQLLRQRFKGIGSLYTGASDTEHFRIGRVVSVDFFFGPTRLQHDVPRGPFRNCRDWLDARLQLILKDCETKLQDEDDVNEDDSDDLDDTLALAAELRDSLAKIFPETGDVESTCLFHDDLNWQNFMVDTEGALTAILDWECIYAAPLWKACQVPGFLLGKPRQVRPDQANYYKPDPEAVRRGEDFDLFQEHTLEYEQTSLRSLFKHEMDRAMPEWTSVYEQSHKKADFEFAVSSCESELWRSRAREWLHDVLAGNDRRLRGAEYGD